VQTGAVSAKAHRSEIVVPKQSLPLSNRRLRLAIKSGNGPAGKTAIETMQRDWAAGRLLGQRLETLREDKPTLAISQSRSASRSIVRPKEGPNEILSSLE
jgi:hypothetical protein